MSVSRSSWVLRYSLLRIAITGRAWIRVLKARSCSKDLPTVNKGQHTGRLRQDLGQSKPTEINSVGSSRSAEKRYTDMCVLAPTAVVLSFVTGFARQ